MANKEGINKNDPIAHSSNSDNNLTDNPDDIKLEEPIIHISKTQKRSGLSIKTFCIYFWRIIGCLINLSISAHLIYISTVFFKEYSNYNLFSRSINIKNLLIAWNIFGYLFSFGNMFFLFIIGFYYKFSLFSKLPLWSKIVFIIFYAIDIFYIFFSIFHLMNYDKGSEMDKLFEEKYHLERVWEIILLCYIIFESIYLRDFKPEKVYY